MPGVLAHFSILPPAPPRPPEVHRKGHYPQKTEVLGEMAEFPPGRQLLRQRRRHGPACPRSRKPGACDWIDCSSNPGMPGLLEPIRTALLLESGEGFGFTMATGSLLKGKLRPLLCFLLNPGWLRADRVPCSSFLFLACEGSLTNDSIEMKQRVFS